MASPFQSRDTAGVQTPWFMQVFWWGIAYLLVLTPRLLTLAFPPTAFLYNVDELQLTQAAIDRFLGLPPSCLHWPGSTLQFLFVPVFVLDFVVSRGIPHGAANTVAALGDHIAYACAHSDRYVLILRAMQIFLSSLAPLLVYAIARRLSGSRSFALVCAAVFAFEPMLFQYSVMAVGDATGITLGVAGMASLICLSNFRRFEYAGLLFGAAAASKITTLALVIFPVLYIVVVNESGLRARGTALLRFFAGSIVGFLFCNPWVWTDPVRYAKATIGNVEKDGTHVSLEALLALWYKMTGVTIFVLSACVLIGAFWILARRRNRVLMVGIASALLGMLPTLLHANTSFPRYLLPALPSFLVVAAVSFEETKLLRQRYRWWRNISALLGALALAGTLTEALYSQIQLRQPDDFMNALAYARRIPKSVTLYAPQETMATVRLQPSPTCMRQIVSMVRSRVVSGDATLAFLAQRGLPRQQSTTLLNAFNEDDQSLLGELVARESYVGSDSREVVFYSDHPNDRMSVSSMNQSEAIAAARSGRGAILLPKLDLELAVPVWKGRQKWAWYQFN